MSMQALMSAAHAAGYAMAAEDMTEPAPEAVQPGREGTAVALRTPQPATFDVLKSFKALRRPWLSEWFAAHWPGGATA